PRSDAKFPRSGGPAGVGPEPRRPAAFHPTTCRLPPADLDVVAPLEIAAIGQRCDQSRNEIVLVVCSSACQFAPCSANCLPCGAVFRTSIFESLRKFTRSDETPFTAGELRK